MLDVSYFSAWRPKAPGALSRRKKRVAVPMPPPPAVATTNDVVLVERPAGVVPLLPDRPLRRPLR